MFSYAFRLWPCALAALVVAASPAHGAQFVASLDYQTSGAAGTTIRAGDFNGDGHADLAMMAAGYVSQPTMFHVLLNSGNGEFLPPMDLATTIRGSYYGMAVGDFNSDGRSDVVVTNGTSQTVSVLLSNSNGTLQAPVSYVVNVPLGAGAVAAGDFNGDGKADLLTANASQGVYRNTSVLIGNGNGTFQAAISQTSDPSLTESTSIAIGDFNGDGKADAAVVTGNNSAVDILQGAGNGTFQDIGYYYQNLGHSSSRVIATDINGDGKLDLVMNSSVRLGNGNGTFQAEVATFTGFFEQDGGVAIGVADFNSDGKPDVVKGMGSISYSSMSMAVGNGNGTFQPPVGRQTYGGSDFAVADFNADGKSDVAMLDAETRLITVRFGDGAGWFRVAASYAATQSVYNDSACLVTGDFNNDGRLDLAGPETLRPGSGTGTFPTSTTITGLSTATSLSGADFNADGKLDLAGNQALLLGNGNGTFQSPVSLPENCYRIAAADFNSDGKPDIAAVVALNAVVPLYATGNVRILLCGTGGSFTMGATRTTSSTIANIAVGDVNGDGLVDVVATHYPNLSVMLGNGDGSLQAPVPYIADLAYSLTLADVNGDGKLDIVAASSSYAGTVSVLLNNGNGTFQSALQCYAFELPQNVTVADLTGDGKADLAVASFRCVSLLAGNGNGTFQAPILFDTEGNTKGISARDFNSDGRMDLAVATFWSGTVISTQFAVLMNTLPAAAVADFQLFQ
jgi:hypothetical protein